MKCMQVRRSPDEPYRNFYNQISGFEFERGYEYELLVEVTEVPNPPADGSSLRYALKEMVRKDKVTTSTYELEGTRWMLAGQMNAEGEMADALARVEAFATFADGRVAGNSSCNRFGGSYTVDGNGLSISDHMMSTMMACQEPIMRQEQQFKANLAATASYAIDGDTLTLLNADGQTVMTLTADVPATLIGTPWTARNYNNGRGGVTSLVAGTTITLEFRDDGGLSGSAGCNNYKTLYTLDGDKMTIGPSMTTRKMCVEPEGIMEQEQAYLAALETVATYRIEGRQLELRTESGALVASFQAA
jgi:heat shock protein HslJ